MISITYKHTDGAYRLELNGHAGQAQGGRDVVCAGASVLMYALAESLEWHRDECLRLDISLEKGEGSIYVLPDTIYAAEARGAFDTAIAGYMHLANAYPKYIRFTSV